MLQSAVSILGVDNYDYLIIVDLCYRLLFTEKSRMRYSPFFFLFEGKNRKFQRSFHSEGLGQVSAAVLAIGSTK